MTSFLEDLRNGLSIPRVDPKSLSALELAFIGDAVIETVSRTVSVSYGNKRVQELHADAIRRENAKTQSAVMNVLLPLLTEEEKRIYHRGRNAEVSTKAKNASITEYHRATGLEAVIGYLYLSGETARMIDLLKTGWKETGVLQ